MTPLNRSSQRFVLLCGLAFAGKTTLARAIARRLGWVYVGLDGINAERGLRPGGEGLPGEEWERSHTVAMSRLAAAFEAGRSAVLDDTGCFRWLRDRYRELAGRFGVDTTVVFVDSPLELIRSRIERNAASPRRDGIADEVFARHVAEFELPAPGEHVLRFTPENEIDAWIDACFIKPAVLGHRQS